MLRPDLTLEVAEREVGNVVDRVEWKITPDSNLWGVFRDYNFVKRYHGEDRPDLALSVEMLFDQGISDHRILAIDDFYIGDRIRTVIAELILNALEHGGGSSYDSKGVLVRRVFGDRGFFVSVDQPGKGPNINDVYQRVLRGYPPESFLRTDDGGVERGLGTMNLVGSKLPECWYENLPSGGARAIALVTAEKVRACAKSLSPGPETSRTSP